MTANNAGTNSGPEQPLIGHLLELRDRLLRMLLVVLVVFIGLFPFSNEIYILVAEPLMAQLPEGTSMIATEVASPFLTPFKLSLLAAVFLAIPFILYQFWAFVAPGLYKHEKKLVFPLVISSACLFYLGVAFAYFVVFPLIFAFLTSVAPEGVAVMTDISHYLDFVLALFFAFGIAFEVPIATILLVWMGVTTPDALRAKRPYVIVGAFVVGMFLTPPDIISQTLLALPMWILFEIGVFFSKLFVNRDRDEEVDVAGYKDSQAGAGREKEPEPAVETEARSASEQGDPETVSEDRESETFVPATNDEMEVELVAIEEEVINDKLHEVQRYRDNGDVDGARSLLYEVLEEGDADQRNVARNILAQLDTP